MRILYLIGPYRGKTRTERDHNIDVARRAAETLWRCGYAVICPHLNTARFDDLGDIPEERFLLGSIKFLMALRREASIVLLPRWQFSEGSKMEQLIATFLGMEMKPYEEYLNAETGK